MNYTNRFHELNSIFNMGVNTNLTHSLIDINWYSFQSNFKASEKISFTDNVFSDMVPENKNFIYPVFVPRNIKKSSKAILLVHGLNERSWNKYLTWAEYLCEYTGKAVILFPLAFHINRSPVTWSNPRLVRNAFDMRQQIYGEDRTLSFANLALSERITQNPYRFYNSGLQSISDLVQLLTGIKKAYHPLFEADTHFDVFAYSIGALLSQVVFLANPNSLFADSKLFMFCGGSVFSAMVGKTRLIMDKVAFEKLLAYYSEEFLQQSGKIDDNEQFRNSFYSMISPHNFQSERQNFFKKLAGKLSGISLKQDKVIPYEGVIQALGTDTTSRQIQLLDFNYEYCHENPFPVSNPLNQTEVNQAFETVFSSAAEFLQ